MWQLGGFTYPSNYLICELRVVLPAEMFLSQHVNGLLLTHVQISSLIMMTHQHAMSRLQLGLTLVQFLRTKDKDQIFGSNDDLNDISMWLVRINQHFSIHMTSVLILV